MKTFLKSFIACTLIPSLLFGGGSSYSRYGIGDLLYFGGNRAYALGGCGIATLHSEYLNQFNPAGLSKLLITQFSSAFENNTISSSTRYGSSKYNTYGFQSFFIAIPISIDNGIALSMEYTPYSSVAYAIRRTTVLPHGTSTNTYYGTGGIAFLGVGLSLSLTDNLHLGLKVANYFGKNEQYIKADYDVYYDADYERSTYYNGFGTTVGVLYEHIGKELNIPSLETLSLGLIFSPPTQLSANDIAYYPLYDTTVTKRKGNSELPFSFGIGASYVLKNTYQLLTDFHYQQWASAKHFGRVNQDLRNAFRFALGVERLPQFRQPSFWQRTAYRLGAYYHATYYNIHGRGIDEYGFTAGIGLPLGTLGKLDVAFQYGVRGTTAYDLQRDTFYRISLGVTVREQWFIQFEEE
ncbi:MAG: hypothetical protein N3A63_03840 [Bacteroidetes bacterium]|nr:hypothetical protein [Bacteroidota bacterium]